MNTTVRFLNCSVTSKSRQPLDNNVIQCTLEVLLKVLIQVTGNESLQLYNHVQITVQLYMQCHCMYSSSQGYTVHDCIVWIHVINISNLKVDLKIVNQTHVTSPSETFVLWTELHSTIVMYSQSPFRMTEGTDSENPRTVHTCAS